jgi:alkylation response protein AidB-like acyl-CoA dehydrogenase
MMILFARTAVVEGDRHAGVSQFLVDLTWPGISVRPVINLPGEHDFNEVSFTDVFIPDEMVVGEVGNGWKQVTSELAYERSSPDRYLSTFEVVKKLTALLGPNPGERETQALGRLASHLWTLQRMSLSVASMLQAGQNPNVEASLVKDLGTQIEQEIPEIARSLVPLSARLKLNGRGEDFAATLERSIAWAPAFSIRGGTREILRGIIARGLGLR